MTTTLEERPAQPPRTVVRTAPASAERPPARRTSADVRLAVSRVLIVVALLGGWSLAYLTLLSGFSASHDQHALYQRFRTELADGTAPVGEPIATGAPVAVLSIPRAGVKGLVVVEGTGTSELQHGPGHYRGSVLPGQHGTSLVLGRALSFGGPFAHLDRLRVGDPITVTTAQGTFTYAVQGARRKGDPVPAAPAATDGRLTLVTAVGSGPFSRLSPSRAVFVDATLTGKAVVGGAVGTTVATERPMSTHVGSGTLALLALTLQLLVLTLLAGAWLRHRWSPLGAWIVATPMVLGSLWAVSSLASRMLPNLF